MTSTATPPDRSLLDNWQPQWRWAMGNKYGYRQALSERNEQLDKCHFDSFSVKRMSSVFGAEISDIDLQKPLSDLAVEELHQAICDYHVIVFKAQHLSQQQIADFALQLGDLNINPLRKYAKDALKVDRVLHDEKRNSVENVWHIDETWRSLPPWLTMLQLKDCPRGGDTLFSSLEWAYQGLDDEFKAMLENVYCEYDHRCWLKEPMCKNFDVTKMLEQFPPIQHPIVRAHPITGLKQLYFSPTFLSKLVGLPEGVNQNDVVLRLLWEVSTPEFQTRIQWSEGDLCIFDNYANIHYATFDYWPNLRSIDRTCVQLPPQYREAVERQVKASDFKL